MDTGGAPVDGPENGLPPALWDVNAAAAYGGPFTNKTVAIEVPHTASVKPCHQCQMQGRLTCKDCKVRLGPPASAWIGGALARTNGPAALSCSRPSGHRALTSAEKGTPSHARARMRCRQGQGFNVCTQCDMMGNSGACFFCNGSGYKDGRSCFHCGGSGRTKCVRPFGDACTRRAEPRLTHIATTDAGASR